MKLIFFGAGYCSKYILPKLNSDFEIICTHSVGIRSENFDKDLNIVRTTLSEFKKNIKFYIKDTTHIINSIPPIQGKDLIYNLLTNIDKKFYKSFKWLGYFSSTSVYGDHSGNWVNEETVTIPQTSRGKDRKTVENLFGILYKKYNLPIHIFRLPGIYGPGRSALDKLVSGNKLIIKKPNQFFSRIHVEDIASAIIKSMQNSTPGEVFNLTDNFPCPSEDVTEYAARLLDICDVVYSDLPSASVSNKVKDFYKDSKKVSNKKIKKILGWTPKFENYKLGLDYIYKENFNG